VRTAPAVRLIYGRNFSNTTCMLCRNCFTMASTSPSTTRPATFARIRSCQIGRAPCELSEKSASKIGSPETAGRQPRRSTPFANTANPVYADIDMLATMKGSVRNRFEPPRAAPRRGWRWSPAIGNRRFAAVTGRRRGGFGLSLGRPDCLWHGPGRLRPVAASRLGSGVGKEVLLPSGCEACHGAMVGRRTHWGESLRWRPQALVAQEALDAFGVTDQSAQFHAAPAGRALVHGQAEGQGQ
jgi:hypothetical protein